MRSSHWWTSIWQRTARLAPQRGTDRSQGEPASDEKCRRREIAESSTIGRTRTSEDTMESHDAQEIPQVETHAFFLVFATYGQTMGYVQSFESLMKMIVCLYNFFEKG